MDSQQRVPIQFQINIIAVTCCMEQLAFLAVVACCRMPGQSTLASGRWRAEPWQTSASAGEGKPVCSVRPSASDRAEPSKVM